MKRIIVLIVGSILLSYDSNALEGHEEIGNLSQATLMNLRQQMSLNSKIQNIEPSAHIDPMNSEYKRIHTLEEQKLQNIRSQRLQELRNLEVENSKPILSSDPTQQEVQKIKLQAKTRNPKPQMIENPKQNLNRAPAPGLQTAQNVRRVEFERQAKEIRRNQEDGEIRNHLGENFTQATGIQEPPRNDAEYIRYKLLKYT